MEYVKGGEDRETTAQSDKTSLRRLLTDLTGNKIQQRAQLVSDLLFPQCCEETSKKVTV